MSTTVVLQAGIDRLCDFGSLFEMGNLRVDAGCARAGLASSARQFANLLPTATM